DLISEKGYATFISQSTDKQFNYQTLPTSMQLIYVYSICQGGTQELPQCIAGLKDKEELGQSFGIDLSSIGANDQVSKLCTDSISELAELGLLAEGNNQHQELAYVR